MSSGTASPLNIFSIGASRNIGYYASLKLLQTGATVTFLLRNPSVFDNDSSIQPFISSRHARIIKGDALVKEDVARAWAESLSCNDEGRIDYLLFTLGGKPSISLTKGAIITPPNLVTLSLLNTLSTLPSSLCTPSGSSHPIKIIMISSTGLTPASHASVPALLKPLYGYLLSAPHADKAGAERILHHLIPGWSWSWSGFGSGSSSSNADAADPSASLLPSNWQSTEGLPSEGGLKHVVVIRPSLLNDGESKGEKFDEARKQGKVIPQGKEPYRVSTEKELGGYMVSRKDVAHFVVQLMTRRWDEFENKIVNISN